MNTSVHGLPNSRVVLNVHLHLDCTLKRHICIYNSFGTCHNHIQVIIKTSGNPSSDALFS